MEIKNKKGTIFLTSDLNHYHKIDEEKIANEIDNKNGLVKQLKDSLKKNRTLLYIAADASDTKKVNLYANILFEALKLSNIEFENYYILDEESKNHVKEYVDMADFIFLSGGNTFLQNKFFNEINLKELLKDYSGVIMGQSAGSINLATDVFNSPENMENSDPIYLKGLGLIDINVEPHFRFDDKYFNEAQEYNRNYILNESKKRNIYGLYDGSHIKIDDKTIVYGKSYLISNGEINLICNDLDEFRLK